MQLRVAEEKDSAKLKEYFSLSPLPGPVDLRGQRTGSFFDKYKLYSKDHVTYYLEDEEEQVQGLASLIFAPGYINGKEETIGYATDLRISPSRKAILSWSQHFLPILEKERARRDCRFVFSVVARSQKVASNAFLRPRSGRRQLPRYHLYRKFSVIGLHGRLPWAPQVLPGLNHRSATWEDLPRIHAFLIRDRQGLQFPFLAQSEDLKRQIESWLGFHLADLKIVEDAQGQLVGTYALWNPMAVEEVTADSYSGMTATLQQALRFFRWTGCTHPLAKPRQHLKFRYITHLRADNPDVFESILDLIWSTLARDEFVVYPCFEGDLNHLPPKSFIHSEWKCGLFCLLAPTDPFPDFFYQSFAETPPMWELAFM
jgi:hypothetical protein